MVAAASEIRFHSRSMSIPRRLSAPALTLAARALSDARASGSQTHRLSPYLRIQRRRGADTANASGLHRQTLAPQRRALLGEALRPGGKCDPAIRAHHPVPRQLLVAVLAEQPRHQPRPPGQSRTARDLAVARDLAPRNGADDGEYALGGRACVHRGSIAA